MLTGSRTLMNSSFRNSGSSGLSFTTRKKVVMMSCGLYPMSQISCKEPTRISVRPLEAVDPECSHQAETSLLKDCNSVLLHAKEQE